MLKRGSPPGTTGRGVNSTGNDRMPIGVLRLTAMVWFSFVETHQLTSLVDALGTVLTLVGDPVRLTDVFTHSAHLCCRHAFGVLLAQHDELSGEPLQYISSRLTRLAITPGFMAHQTHLQGMLHGAA